MLSRLKENYDQITQSTSVVTWILTLKSMPSPQLVTTQSKPRALAKSLVVSVLPVPAGPAGAPPRYIDRA